MIRFLFLALLCLPANLPAQTLTANWHEGGFSKFKDKVLKDLLLVKATVKNTTLFQNPVS